MILAALQMMPEEHIDAARVDGASPWQMLWYVTLPYLKGVLLVAGPLPPDRQHQGLSADLHPDGRRAGHADGGDQLLRLRPGLQLQLSRLFERNHRRAGRLHRGAELADPAPGRLGARCRVEPLPIVGATERRLIYALVIVLAAMIMLPFVWLVLMSFKTNDDIFAFPPKLLFRADAAELRGAVGLLVPLLVPQQRHRLGELDAAGPARRRAGRLCPLAHIHPAREAALAADPGVAHGAADRLHHPLLPRLPLDGPAWIPGSASSSSTSPSTSRSSCG